MKKPRVNDFDPNNTASLASPLDGMPEIQPPSRNSNNLTLSHPRAEEDTLLPDSPNGQSTGESITQSIDRSTHNVPSRVLEKPKAFYITVDLDKRIDHAVRYLKEMHGIKKVDRSVVVTALLDNELYWTDDSLDHLVDPVVRHLTHRMTGK